MAANQPPDLFQNPVVEEAFLGACILRPDRVDFALVREDYLQGRDVLRLYRALLQLRQEGRTVDLVSMAEEGRRLGVDGAAVLVARCVEESALDIRECLRTLRRCWQRRQVRIAAESLLVTVRTHALDLEEALPAILAQLAHVTADRIGLELYNLAEVAIAEATRLTSAPADFVSDCCPTGLRALDVVMGGIPYYEETILAGRPGMGKTALAQQVVEFVAETFPDDLVLYASPEMNRGALARRSLSRRAGVNLRDLRLGKLTPIGRSNVLTVAQEVPRVHGLDHGQMTVADIRAAAHGLAGRGRLRLVVVDHLQHLRKRSRFQQSETDMLGEAAIELKGIGSDTGAAVLVLSQLNRDCEKRPDKRPKLPDLRGSGDIEQVADTVMFLFRAGYYNRKLIGDQARLVEVDFAKTRNGPVGVMRMEWAKEQAAFRDIPGQYLGDRPEGPAEREDYEA